MLKRHVFSPVFWNQNRDRLMKFAAAYEKHESLVGEGVVKETKPESNKKPEQVQPLKRKKGPGQN